MKLPRYTIVIVALVIMVGSYYISNNQAAKEFVGNQIDNIDSAPNDYVNRTNEKIKIPKFITDYNFRHILEGNINRNGEATGYHHAPSSKDKTTKVLNITNEPNNCGVYKAKVQVKGKIKKALSSMFPDKYSEQQILDIITNAYNEGTKNNPTNSTFTAKADDCIKVFMVLDSGRKIITSYPIY
jgi:Bacterial EndoU nuclease